jgi:hypothetical protein
VVALELVGAELTGVEVAVEAAVEDTTGAVLAMRDWLMFVAAELGRGVRRWRAAVRAWTIRASAGTAPTNDGVTAPAPELSGGTPPTKLGAGRVWARAGCELDESTPIAPPATMSATAATSHHARRRAETGSIAGPTVALPPSMSTDDAIPALRLPLDRGFHAIWRAESATVMG